MWYMNDIAIKLFKKKNLAVTGLSFSTWNLYAWHVGSSSVNRDQTQALCLGSTES